MQSTSHQASLSGSTQKVCAQKSSSQEINAQKKHLMPITPRPDFAMVRGEGHYLYDNQGKAYLDLIQGWAVNTLGHSPQIIQQTLTEQAGLLVNPGPAFYNQPMLNLAQKLCKNSVLDQVFFANSGAEANEGAIKLARKWGQKHKQGAFNIITFNRAFHGRTLATMSACGKAAFEPLFEPKVSGFTKVDYNDLMATEQAINPNTVAIMLELVQGEGGVIPADPEFVKGLEQLCQQHNLLLIVDEVQTGIGRTGSLFAYQDYCIKPHMMTLGKGLGGGVPISALLVDESVSCFDYGDQGGTYNGNPLMCAVSDAVLSEVLKPEFLDQVNTSSDYLKQSLEQLSAEFGLGAVRGKGLLLALDTGSVSASDIVEKTLEQGLLLNAPRPDTLRFMPALTLGQKEIDKAMSILKRVLSQVLNQGLVADLQASGPQAIDLQTTDLQATDLQPEDLEPFLAVSKHIDWQQPEILMLAKQLAEGTDNKTEIAKNCFEFVRDQVKHSWDFQLNPVTCKASDVLKHNTGYCYAKSHLLAALLRANGIPAGLCYQRLTISHQQPPFCLHGLNAVYFEQHGWYRLDARGNRVEQLDLGKEGVDAQFCPPEEQLAYPIVVAGEADLPGVYPEPLPQVVYALETYDTVQLVAENLPDIALAEAGFEE